MEIKFVVDTHIETGKPMVKVRRDGKFVAGIYHHEEGVRIVSKYLDGVKHQAGMPPSIVIRFSDA